MRTLAEAINKVTETLGQKGDLYGPTYRRVGLLLNVPSQYSILVRMTEKICRLDNILAEGQDNRRQAVAEEFLDLACYAILAMFESWPEEHDGPGMKMVNGKLTGYLERKRIKEAQDTQGPITEGSFPGPIPKDNQYKFTGMCRVFGCDRPCVAIVNGYEYCDKHYTERMAQKKEVPSHQIEY